MRPIDRRHFLKAAQAAAAALTYAARSGMAGVVQAAATTDVRISDKPYSPAADYPIQPKAYHEVTLTDRFWKPRVDTNAAVTIPFEVARRCLA